MTYDLAVRLAVAAYVGFCLLLAFGITYRWRRDRRRGVYRRRT